MATRMNNSSRVGARASVASAASRAGITLKPTTDVALKEALKLGAAAASKVYTTKKGLSNTVTLKGHNYTHVFGQGTTAFPAGSKVFDNNAGTTGVVVGTEQSGRFSKTRLLVKTAPEAGAMHVASPNSLALLSAGPVATQKSSNGPSKKRQFGSLMAAGARGAARGASAAQKWGADAPVTTKRKPATRKRKST